MPVNTAEGQPAYPGSAGKWPLKWCVCMHACDYHVVVRYCISTFCTHFDTYAVEVEYWHIGLYGFQKAPFPSNIIASVGLYLLT